MKSLKDVIERIKRLLNISTERGNSPAEAATAAAEAQRLILQYQLDAGSLKPSAESLQIVDEDLLPLVGRDAAQEWEVLLAGGVCAANGCCLMKHGKLWPGMPWVPMVVHSLSAIGTRSRVDMVKMLFPLLHEQLQQVGQRRLQAGGRAGLEDFMKGASHAVGERLFKERMDARARASANDNALERVDEDLQRAQDYVDAQATHTESGGLYVDDPSTFYAGRAAGRGINTNVGQKRETESPRQLTAGGG